MSEPASQLSAIDALTSAVLFLTDVVEEISSGGFSGTAQARLRAEDANAIIGKLKYTASNPRQVDASLLEMTFESFPIGASGFVKSQQSLRWDLGYRMSQNFWRTEVGGQMEIKDGDRFIRFIRSSVDVDVEKYRRFMAARAQDILPPPGVSRADTNIKSCTETPPES